MWLQMRNEVSRLAVLSSQQQLRKFEKQDFSFSFSVFEKIILY